MTYFVTGSTGFIGSALVRRLIGRGDQVHLLVRPESAIHLNHPAIKVFRGTLADAPVLREGMRGCEGLFHLAAKGGVDARDPKDFDRTNLEGTRQMIAAALASDIKKFVYTSSVMCLGPSQGQAVDENTPRKVPFFTDYDRSKALAEDAIRHAVRDGLPAVIVSPAFVYGPTSALRGDSFNAYLLAAARQRIVGVPGLGTQVFNAVYIDDVVEGHLLAFENGNIGENYILGGENIALREMIECLASLLKENRFILKVPLLFLKMLGRLVGQIAKIQGKAARMTAKSSEIYNYDWAYTSEKAIREIAYRNRPLRAGLELTLTGLKKRVSLSSKAHEV